jgi:hypothetical protein
VLECSETKHFRGFVFSSLLENLHIDATLNNDLCNALALVFCLKGSVRIFSSHFIFYQCFIHDYYEILLNCIFISEASETESTD